MRTAPSSTFMNQTDLLRRVVAALDSLPVRGLVTTGPEIDPATIASTRRVQVVRSAPHATVLPQPQPSSTTVAMAS